MSQGYAGDGGWDEGSLKMEWGAVQMSQTHFQAAF